MKKVIKKRNIITMLVVVTIFCIYSNQTVIYASGLSDSKLVTGTTKLVNDGLKVLTGLIAAVGTLFEVWQAIKMQGAEDEGDVKIIKKKMKTILVCTIGGTMASALVSLIVGYYA